jgi:catechol 2,3-dioxygenase-like lactoylglutathione lyase family enzyme
MKITALAHACILTPNLARARQFYQDVLGTDHCFDFHKKGNVIGFYLKITDRQFIEFFQADSISTFRGKAALDHVCFECDDLVGLREKVLTAGYEPGKISMGCDHSEQFWVKGPDGLDIEFQQYTGNSAQKTGLDVEVDW